MWFPTDLSVHGTQFVMVGVSLVHSGTPGVWTSLDGRSWSGPAPLPVTASAAWAFDLETDGSLLLAVGDDVTYGPGPATSTGSVWMTADGESWRQLPPDGLEGSAVGEMVLHFKGAWVVLGHTDADPSIPAVWHEI